MKKKKEQYQNTVVLSNAVAGKGENTRILRPLLLVETTSGVKSAAKCISFARLYAVRVYNIMVQASHGADTNQKD